MKHIFYIILFSFFTLSLQAQISVDFMTFPLAGDTLFLSTDNLPTGIEITSQGSNQIWDFSSLEAPFAQETIYKSATEGSQSDTFPNAQMVTIGQGGAETYYSVDNNILEVVGYAGEDPIGLGVNILTRVTPSTILRRSPMTYLDINNSSSETSTPFSADLLPEFILEQLPITPDSLRIRTTTERRDLVDAWGELTIPGGTFNVLREKRIAYNDRRLDVKIGLFPWQDITDLLTDILPGGLGIDTTVTYHYFSNVTKEPIAIVSMNSDESVVQSVRYKTIDLTTSISSTSSGKPDIIAYPNPAIESARFSFTNLKKGTYTLKIYNILAIVIWQEDYEVFGNKTVNMDFTDFRKGTYLYSLQDEDGNTIATKRLLIIRP